MLIDTNRNVTAALPRLKAAGVTSICRYLSCLNPGNAKVIKSAEAHEIAAAGMKLWLVYEIGGHPSGAAIGKRDGEWALNYAPTVGAPPGAAIYYTVDFDAGPSDMPGIIEAFRAFHAAVIPTYRVGCYASGYVCKQMKALGLSEFSWLTDSTGFRGTREAIAAGDYDIRQALPHEVGGIDTDPDTLRIANGDIGDFVPFAGADHPAIVAQAPAGAATAAPPVPAGSIQPPGPAAQPTPASGRIAGLLPLTVAGIVTLAVGSDLIHHNWGGRGLAPRGYIKGMATAFGVLYARWRRGPDALTAIMAAANSRNAQTDALSWYAGIFTQAGMSNDGPDADTLRHLLVLMTGLGMRESAGNCFEGRDMSASNVSADSAEAGLFQMSYDIRGGCPLIASMLAAEQIATSDEDSLLSIFREGAHATDAGMRNYGTGDGATFQRLLKARPLFSVECCGVGLRRLRSHWGPVNRREAELVPGADVLFKAVQALVDAEGASA